MKYLRGDLSAPVLAILVTIGIIAAGLILLAWFWWFAPQAGKAGSLQILGTPAISPVDNASTLYVSVRNTGNDNISITGIYVEGRECSFTPKPMTVAPGESKDIVANCTNVTLTGKHTVSGVIVTNYGTYTFIAAVIR